MDRRMDRSKNFQTAEIALAGLSSIDDELSIRYQTQIQW